MTFDPRNAVTFVIDNHNGSWAQGSGVMISPDLMLTASHVVEEWNIVQGDPHATPLPVPATDIRITPNNTVVGDPFGAVGAFGTISGVASHYNDVATTPFGVQGLDYAVVKLAHPVNTGYMGLDPYFTGGAATYSGYPAILDANGNFVSSGPMINVADNLTGGSSPNINFDYFSDSHSPGASGGPTWIQTANGPEVVAIMSGQFAGSGIQAAISVNAFSEIEMWEAQEGESGTIMRLYHETLGRAPDAAGLSAWSAALLSDMIIPTQDKLGPVVHFQSGADVLNSHLNLVDGFLNSAEFRAHGTLADTAFVTLLYAGALGRSPDAPGLTGWDAALANHSWNREQVVVAIGQSPEAIHHSTIYGTMV